MKVIVIGCPGSGKSTFSKILHNITKIPIYHLDMLNWKENKTTIDKTLFGNSPQNLDKFWRAIYYEINR